MNKIFSYMYCGGKNTCIPYAFLVPNCQKVHEEALKETLEVRMHAFLLHSYFQIIKKHTKQLFGHFGSKNACIPYAFLLQNYQEVHKLTFQKLWR